MDIIQVLGSTLGLGFLSGIRLYATVFALGLAIRFDVFHLSQMMSQLAILADTRVLAAAAVACAIEFVADKVPWVDSGWDALHTFIRPVAAALLASTALAEMDPVLRTVLSLACGGVALTAHSTKAATRLVVNHSPEPFSNVALSLAEDVAAPVGLWLVWQYPHIFLGALAVFLTIFFLIAPRIFRLLRLELLALTGFLFRWLGESRPAAVGAPPAIAGHPGALEVWVALRPLLAEVPDSMADAAGVSTGVRSAATGSSPGLRCSVGWLCFSGDQLVFVTRRGFRVRRQQVPLSSVLGCRWRSGFFLDQIVITTAAGDLRFDIFKRPPAVQPHPEAAAAV